MFVYGRGVTCVSAGSSSLGFVSMVGKNGLYTQEYTHVRLSFILIILDLGCCIFTA